MQKAENSRQWAVGSGQKLRERLGFAVRKENGRFFQLRSLFAGSRLGVRRLQPTAHSPLPTILVSCLLLTAHFTLPTAAKGQKVIDKMVATVNAGLRPECGEVCLITYSDLLWQLALQPDSNLDNPTSDELNRALRLVIDQRLILQEAEKLPSIGPTTQEVRSARDELVRAFATSRPEVRQRLRRVGLTGEKLDQILEQRVRIEKYLDFRFRNFVVITQKEIADYYKDVYVPRLRARAPGQIVPTLEAARDEIEKILTEAKIESDTDAFLDTARERAEIVMLNPV